MKIMKQFAVKMGMTRGEKLRKRKNIAARRGGDWYSNSVAESNTDKTGTFTTADKTYDSDVFDFAVGGIKNQLGVVLPATGGEGNMKIFAAAIAAAMVAVVAACMALKVRRRQ